MVELATQKRRMEQLTKEISAAQSETKAPSRELDQNSVALDASRKRVDDTLRSTRWWMSAPLRLIGKLTRVAMAIQQRKSDARRLTLRENGLIDDSANSVAQNNQAIAESLTPHSRRFYVRLKTAAAAAKHASIR